MTPRSPLNRSHPRSRTPLGARLRRGVSFAEMMFTLSIFGVMLLLTARGIKRLQQQQLSERLGRAVLWEVTVARSYALRSGIRMSLKVDNTTKTLTIKSEFGDVYRTLKYDQAATINANQISLNVLGDSLAFSSRGLCLNCNAAGTTEITVATISKTWKMKIGPMGRAELIGLSRT